MVTSALPGDKKPDWVTGGSVASAASFDEWYTTVAAKNVADAIVSWQNY
jgi:hypothetical protein